MPSGARLAGRTGTSELYIARGGEMSRLYVSAMPSSFGSNHRSPSTARVFEIGFIAQQVQATIQVILRGDVI